jgi:hypothetical protein
MPRSITPLVLATALVTASPAWPQTADREAGVTAAANPQVEGAPPSATARALTVGVTVFERERITTSANGQAHLLFRDGSSFTVAPNSNLVLDEFVYDPAAQKGHLAMSLGKGVFRFVGGKLSKDGAVTLNTPSAALAVRGGIVVVEVTEAGHTSATLLYGESLTVRSHAGQVTSITRPGFGVTVPAGGPPGEAHRTPAGQLAGHLGQLGGQPGQNGGHPAPPSTPMVSAALHEPVGGMGGPGGGAGGAPSPFSGARSAGPGGPGGAGGPPGGGMAPRPPVGGGLGPPPQMRAQGSAARMRQVIAPGG